MGGNQMSAREAKNPATKQFTKIDDILNVGNNTDMNDDVNVDGNEDVKLPQTELELVNGELRLPSDTSNESTDTKMAALKAKMQATRKKESNQQVTVYLTPKNYKRFNQLKEKGQKSELINRLLDMYFEE